MKLIAIILLSFVYSATINIPADYPTIQEGINASADGDTVFVVEGAYYENINFNDKNKNNIPIVEGINQILKVFGKG